MTLRDLKKSVSELTLIPVECVEIKLEDVELYEGDKMLKDIGIKQYDSRLKVVC
jgi:hypothetical protein